jgi:DNA invertase Pin-like site-specific DNA recombinase
MVTSSSTEDLTMKDAIGYLRVSTQEQGRSGLGLAAQRFDIKAFGSREGFSVKAWYQDIQTGAGKDALLLRPGLAAALKEARAARCPLIVSRLDRLSRNVHFITGLMEHKVHFVVAVFGRDVDDFTLHIYASIAEQERKMISERVRAATLIAQNQGRKFGLQLRPKSWQRRVSALGRAALIQEANDRAQAYRMYVEWALRQPGVKERPISFAAAAKKLNARNIETPLGGRWRGHQLQRMARRLDIDHPLARMPERFARARVRALFELRPNLTGEQVVTEMGAAHALWIRRAYALLKECRQDAARRSSVHKQVGWYLDHRTATRIRIGELWRRHPEFTGKQVMKKLKLGPDVPLKWVQRIMNDCWKAYAKPKPKQRRIGRKFHNPWRSHELFRKSRSVNARRA